MIFVLWYDRGAGILKHIVDYPENSRGDASSYRLKLELELLAQGISNEVVMLEAESLDALRKTHNRYFRKISELTGGPLRASSHEPKKSDGQ